jgi:hypothetical protein
VTLGTIGLGYLGAGVVVAIAVSVARGIPSAGDAVLLVAMWPLWGPLAFARADRDHRENQLLAALARAQSSPLAGMLPDADAARVLGSRLREASQRLVDLDTVLARPDFDPDVAAARAKDLAARGALAAAATAELRVRTLGQLRTLRERYRSELEEVNELIAQLVTQAELVRLQPAIAHSSAELVQELVARVEGLDDLFAYQAAIEGGQEYPQAIPRCGSA